MGVYCGVAFNETARLCFLGHEGASEPEAKAAESASTWIAAITRRLGSASEQTHEGALWKQSGYEVSVMTRENKEAGNFKATVVYSTREGVASVNQRRPEFPNGVGGFEFGIDDEQVSAECIRSKGSFTLTSDGPAPGFACVLPSIDSPLNIKVVAGYFCAERVCEVSLTLDNRMNDALSLLSAKYGPGSPVDMPPGQCKAEARKHSWFWSSGDEITGWMRVTDDCGVIIFYNDAEGWKLRNGQYIQRKKTY